MISTAQHLSPTVPTSPSWSSESSSLPRTPPRQVITPMNSFILRKRALTPSQKDSNRRLLIPSSSSTTSQVLYSSSPSSIGLVTPGSQFLLPSPTFFKNSSPSSRFSTPLKSPPTPSTPSSSTRHSHYSYLNSPLKRSPARRNLSDFTFNAFAEDEEGFITSPSTRETEEMSWNLRGKELFRGSMELERGRQITNWSKPSGSFSSGKPVNRSSSNRGLGINGVSGSPERMYARGDYDISTSESEDEDFGGREMRRALSEELKSIENSSSISSQIPSTPLVVKSGLQSKFKPKSIPSLRQTLSSSFSSSSSIGFNSDSPSRIQSN